MMIDSMKLDKKRFRLLLAIPFILAALCILAGLVRHGVNTPFWDEWEMVPIFQKIDDGTLPLGDLWDQHNEHRILFPNIVMTAAAYLTDWNIKTELYISFAFSLVSALMLYLFVVTKFARKSIALLAAVLMAAWFYSPVQYDNWLWGWQIEWFMCIAAIMTTIFLLDRFASGLAKHPHWLFGGALAGAAVATYSLGSGIAVWVVGLGILALYRQGKKPIGIWLAGFALSAASYYYGYHKPPDSPSNTVFLEQPMSFVRYILNYFGRPVSDQSPVAALVGSVLLLLLIPLLYMVWVKRAHITRFVPWLSLVALSLITGIVTGMSRLGFGLDQSLSGRYTAFTLLYVIGLTGIVLTLLDLAKPKRNTVIFAALLAFAISGPLLFSSYTNGKAGFRHDLTVRQAIRACTKAEKPTDTCLLSTYPSVKIVEPRLEFIKAKHWGGY